MAGFSNLAKRWSRGLTRRMQTGNPTAVPATGNVIPANQSVVPTTQNVVPTPQIAAPTTPKAIPAGRTAHSTGKNACPTHENLAKALSHVVRWRMLRELSLGEPREIRELAAVGRCSYDSGAKHLRVLVKNGLVTQGRGFLFQIPKSYLPEPGKRVADYGCCVLCLDAVR
jgi:hypothetical protein